MHVPPGIAKPALLSSKPHHFVTTPEIRLPIYPNKVAGGAEWNLAREGHPDLVTLHFFRNDRDFDYYWSVEYDVRFTGSWRRFFSAFDGNCADFLTTSLRTAATDPRWSHWKTLRAPQSGSPIELGEG